MDFKNWQQAENLFNAALDLPEPERLLFLKTECGGNVELLHAVESLLRHHTGSENLEDMVQEAAYQAISEEALPAGTRIGPWAIIREIGKGGMGTVYLAERADEQYDQKVAIKLIADAFINKEILDRFLAERQILARLEHPYIARLLDGGTTDKGIPYLAMEYVEGLPVDEFCNQGRLSVTQRLQLFKKICMAVQYAHQNLVVHRDLKPNNILVNEQGEPRLLDFGIAKILETEDSERSARLTRVGVRLFTPHYSSPEQIKGEPVNTMSDVYSLGVILYELLTGRRPYRLRKDDHYSRERAIVETRAARPSSVLSQPTERYESLRKTDACDGHLEWCGLKQKQLKRLLSGDLDTIVMKALRKEPERRYLSVMAFSTDIDHYLENEPISARPATFSYLGRKFLSRHRLSSTLVLVLSLAVVGFSVTSWVQSKQIAAERDTARVAQGKAEAVFDFLVEMFSSVSPDKAQGREVTVRQVLDETSVKLKQSNHALSTTPELEAVVNRSIGNIYSRLGLLEPAREALESALAYHRSVASPDQEELFFTLSALAGLANLNFDQTTRVEYLLEAQTTSQELWGADHANSQSIRSGLASSYHMQGQLTKAHDLFYELYQIRLRTLGEDAPDTIHSSIQMGIIHHWLGNFDEALKYNRSCLEKATRVLGERSILALQCLSNLASLLETIGEYEDAAPLLEKHIKLGSIVFGENHLEVMRSMHNYADTLRGLNRYEESEALFLETLNRRRTHLGSQHIETFQTQFKLARLYRLMGRYDEAYPLVTNSVQELARQLGEDHPSTQAAAKELEALRQATVVPAENNNRNEQ